jgi:hypothetical protein
MAPMGEMRRSDRAVRSGPSEIHEAGLFVERHVEAGETIGALELGAAGEQGRHTLLVGAEHRVVEPPWRYLNHACTPNATLEIGERDAILLAARTLEPGTELTIDYARLPEKVGTPFVCRCPRCAVAGRAARVGG